MQTVDPNVRKQMDLELTQLKDALERRNATEQQYRAKEAEANSLLLNEQGRWNETNGTLKSIEGALVLPQ